MIKEIKELIRSIKEIDRNPTSENELRLRDSVTDLLDDLIFLTICIIIGDLTIKRLTL